MPARIGVVGTARTVRGRLGVPGREAMVRRRCCAVLVLVVALAFFYGVDTPPRVLSLAREGRGVTGAVARPFGRLPLRFEANVGQFDPRVAYVARQPGATLFLTGEGATLALRSTRQMGDPSHIPRERRPDARSPTRPGVAVRMKVVGGRAVAPRGGLQLETKSNYFLGDDPTKWRTNVASYGRVVYPRVLDGVDLVYHGED